MNIHENRNLTAVWPQFLPFWQANGPLCAPLAFYCAVLRDTTLPVRLQRGQHRIVLEPYGYRWYRVGGLDYLLKRSDIDETTVRGNKHPG